MHVRVARVGEGRFAVSISPEIRQLIRDGVASVREMVLVGDPALARLFPPAHPTDDALEAEWQAMMASQLIEARLASFDLVEESLDAEELDAAQLEGWMQGINAVRLVVGTILGVDDDPSDDEIEPSPLDVLYDILPHVLGMLVRAASGDLRT